MANMSSKSIFRNQISSYQPLKFISGLFEHSKLPESVAIFLTALLVGVGAGLGAVLFRRLITFFQKLFYVDLASLLEAIHPYHLLVIPALGGLIFGPLIYKYAREAKGHGVPEVMEAVALRGGRIRPRVALGQIHLFRNLYRNGGLRRPGRTHRPDRIRNRIHRRPVLSSIR